MLMPRQYVRHPVDLEVRCTSADASLVSRVRNLSRGGLFVASEVTLPVSEELEIALTLPERRDDFRARGQVIWNRGSDPGLGAHPGPHGMGIKFLEMSPVDSESLAQYLAVLPGPAGRGSGTT